MQIDDSQKFAEDFASALERENPTHVIDMENLLHSERWEEQIEAPSDPDKEDAALARSATASELEEIYSSELAKLQRDFLRRYGGRIPAEVWEAEIAHQVGCETGLKVQPWTKVLRSLGATL